MLKQKAQIGRNHAVVGGAGRGECVREASFKDDMDRRSLVGVCVRERESRGGGFQ